MGSYSQSISLSTSLHPPHPFNLWSRSKSAKILRPGPARQGWPAWLRYSMVFDTWLYGLAVASLFYTLEIVAPPYYSSNRKAVGRLIIDVYASYIALFVRWPPTRRADILKPELMGNPSKVQHMSIYPRRHRSLGHFSTSLTSSDYGLKPAYIAHQCTNRASSHLCVKYLYPLDSGVRRTAKHKDIATGPCPFSIPIPSADGSPPESPPGRAVQVQLSG